MNKRSFLIKRGILGFGVPVGLAIFLASFLFEKYDTALLIVVRFTLYVVVVGAGAGLTWGYMMWSRYRKNSP